MWIFTNKEVIIYLFEIVYFLNYFLFLNLIVHFTYKVLKYDCVIH